MVRIVDILIVIDNVKICTSIQSVQTFISTQIFSGADNLDAQEKSKSTFETTVAFKKTSNATYHGADGNPLSKEILADITQFQVIR